MEPVQQEDDNQWTRAGLDDQVPSTSEIAILESFRGFRGPEVRRGPGGYIETVGSALFLVECAQGFDRNPQNREDAP